MDSRSISATAPGANLGQYILDFTENYRERPAFILKEAGGSRRPLSYFEFNELVRRVSLSFRAKYPKPGFKVGLWGENRVEWCVLALGIWHAGGTLVPLMHIATDTEVKNIIAAAHLDALFISPHLQKDENFGVKEVLSMDFAQSRGGRRSLGDILGEARNITSAAAAKLIAEPKTQPQDLAVLIFTSGTTGHPKGVMLTHQNIITNVMDTIDVVPTHKDDRAVSVLPLSHMFELVGGFTIAHLKGICITYPDSLKPEDVLGEMRAHRATFLVAVPLFFEIIDRAIQEQIKKLSPSAQKFLSGLKPIVLRFPWVGKIFFGRIHNVFGGHVRFFVTGGAKIDPEIILRFQSLGISMLQGYGLTETSPVISFTSLKYQKYGSVGKAVRSVQVKIDEPNDKGEGEICVKGPSVFKGYFENPEATSQVIKDGWFHTGDVGRIDEEGFIFITGRKKDMIVTPNGKNVYPEELEECLKDSPLFNEVAVIGLDSGRGEEVHAVVVPSSQAPRDPLAQREMIWREIEKLCEPLADYKRIQGFTVSPEELPKTATKKVKKHLLKEMVASGALAKAGSGAAAGPHTPLNLSAEKEVWLNEKLQQISKKPEIWKEAHLRHDLGIDSLTFMEIISAMETHWGVRVEDEDFANINKVEDLLQRLEQAAPGYVTETIQKEFNYKKNNSAWMNVLRFFVHAIVIRPVLRIFFKFRVFNNQEIKRQKNFIVTPNHSSHLDLLAILSSVPLSAVNRTYAVAADDYFFNTPMKAFVVRLLFNAIPFQRRARIDKGFKVCEDILRDGGNLVIFPEGTRSVTGQMAPFKPGVGRLLASQGYPAIPAYIKGAYEAFPKGVAVPRFRPVSVYFGSPSKFIGEPANLNGYQKVAERLQSDLEELRHRAKVRELST